MPAYKQIWRAAGQVDDAWGRLKILTLAFSAVVALLGLVWLVAIRSLGVVGIVVLALTAVFAVIAVSLGVSLARRPPVPPPPVTTGPDLRIGKTYSELRPSLGGPMQVIRAEVYNARDSGGEPATARDVVPYTEAFDEIGNLIADTRGSWGYDIYAMPVSTVTFRPTRESHPLEVAAKYPDDEHAWVPGARTAELPPGNYVMRISLRGDNLDAPVLFEWAIENPGARLELAARLLPPLTDASKRERVVKALDAAIGQAQRLIDRRVTSPEAWNRWLADHGDWRDLVNSERGALKQTLSTVDYHRVNDMSGLPDFVPVGRFDYNEDHARSRVYIDRRLSNLLQVLKDYRDTS